MQEREITSRIRIDELQGLLDTEEPTTKQRITARMPAVKLEELLQPEPLPPDAVHVTFRAPRHSEHIRPGTLKGTGPNPVITAEPAIEPAARAGTQPDTDERETARLTIRDTIQMAAAEAAGIVGTVNGVPVQVAGVESGMLACGSNPAITPPPTSAIDKVIDAAVDAAIDAEIHNAEIDVAIDAVMLPALAADKQRYGVVALSFMLSFVAGIVIMFLLS